VTVGGPDLRAVTGLTADQAAVRGSAIGDVRYRVHVDLAGFGADGTFTTTTEVRFDCAVPDRPLWLDLIADQVVAVRHNGSDLDPEVVAGPERLLIPAPDAHNRVTVTSRHTAGTAAAGLCRTVDATDGAVYAWTQFQPFDARRMFACFDQPDLRAVIALSVTAPAGWTCLSTTSPRTPDPDPHVGDEVAATPPGTPDALRHTAFAPTPPIPVYLLGLCAGPFASVFAVHDGIRMGVHSRAGLRAELQAAAPELFALTAHGMDAFAAAFGVPYPLTCYDQVLLPDQPGAMENLGCVTWNDAVLYRSAPSTAERVRRALVLLHELSHQWFGDLVTPRWWDDLWLSESFADWAAVWALRTFEPLAGGGAAGHAAHQAAAFRADRMPSTHPVSRDVPDMDAVAANFDAITYGKGACLLAQLVDLIGEEAFLAGLRRYFGRYAWGSVGIGALLGELDHVTDVDVHDWSTQWLRTSGVDTVRVQRDPGAVSMVRDDAEPGERLRRHRIRVGRYRTSGFELAPVGHVLVQVIGPVAAIPFADAIAPDEVLLPGDGLGAYVACRPDPDSMRALLDHGHTLADPASRATLRNLLVDMTFTAELDGFDAVRALVATLATESDDAMLSPIVDQAMDLAVGYVADASRDDACSVLADCCLRVATDAPAGSPRWMAAWRGVARAAVTPDQTDALTRLLAGAEAPQTLRWEALIRLVSWGRAGESEIVAERARDRDPDRERSAALARAATGAPRAKREALDALLSPAAVPIGALPRLAAALWQPHQRHLLGDVLHEMLDRLPDAIAAGGPARAMRIARWCLPEYPIGPAMSERLRDLASDRRLPEVARTALADQAALAERRTRAAATPTSTPGRRLSK